MKTKIVEKLFAYRNKKNKAWIYFERPIANMGWTLHEVDNAVDCLYRARNILEETMRFATVTRDSKTGCRINADNYEVVEFVVTYQENESNNHSLS